MKDITPEFDLIAIKNKIILPDNTGFASQIGGLDTKLASTVVSPTGNIKSGQIAYETGDGFWLGNDEGIPKFSIGDSENYLKWDGSKIDIKGDVSLDSVFYNKRYIYTAFESIDAWTEYSTGTGNSDPTLGEVSLDTGATISSIADIHCEVFVEGDAINFSKNPYFQTPLRLSSITNQTVYITNGHYSDDCFGFKIIDGDLYSIHVKAGTSYTNAITGITLTNYNIYKAIYTSGSKIEFYVNDVLKITVTTNLPIATDVLEKFRYRIQNTASERKYLFSQYLLLNQDL